MATDLPAGPIPPVTRSTTVPGRPDQVFTLFSERIGSWWPVPTHGIFGASSGGAEFHDGHLIERRLDGSHTVWAEVTGWDEGKRVELAWHPGQETDMATRVTFTFTGEATADSTKGPSG